MQGKDVKNIRDDLVTLDVSSATTFAKLGVYCKVFVDSSS